MNPTIGVLITYYNEGPLLRECLDSVFAQSDRPDEILVYDDASADPAERYIPSDMPVRVLRGAKNIGLGAARNELLKESQSEFVHFHDADDLFDACWGTEVRAALLGTGADVVLTEICSFWDKQIVSRAVLELHRLEQSGDLVRFGLQGSILAPTSTFRRQLGLRLGGFRIRDVIPLSEDFDFHVRLAATGVPYHVITDPLVYIRLRPESLSRKNGHLRLDCLAAILTSLCLLEKELPAQYRGDLAERAARIGVSFYRVGDYAQAEAAFALTRQFGPASFSWYRQPYRIIARYCGPEAAEQVGVWYRRLLPETLRKRFAVQRER